ncbi:MAG: bifunctional hydroxymethylpyrimidine kinase/phosphomethylpyrimidine kinase [Desulfonatronovibrionaceae bacterium]
MPANIPPCILTIAGSDSGGGAGIQADLKTITVLGGYGLSVLTALTAQNTLGVQAIHAVPEDFVRKQLDSVLSDFPVQAAKTGMLFSEKIIRTVAEKLQDRQFPLVVDPVCMSQSGDKLLEDRAIKALLEDIVPRADLITPNRPEAELLTKIRIDNDQDIRSAAQEFLSMGCRAVLIKGGHFDRDMVRDWLFTPGQEPICIQKERIRTSNTHGTGCTLSAALAVFLARETETAEAARRSREFLHQTLSAAFSLGSGQGPVNHLAEQSRHRACKEVLHTLETLRDRLVLDTDIGPLIPEVGMNIAFSPPWPRSPKDIAAFDGRIRRTKSGRLIAGCPSFGSSSHMAKVLLSARRLNPKIHCAANIRFSERILSAANELRLPLAWFDRADEPRDVKEKEGSSLEWGTLRALEGHKSPATVKIVADRGEAGKEAMLRVLAQDVDELDLLLTKLSRMA